MRRQHLLWLALAGCPASNPGTEIDAPPATISDAAPDAGPPPELPALEICRVASARNINGALVTSASADWVSYACVDPCSDWTQCTFAPVDQSGQPLLSPRGSQPYQALLFVVDGMAGHIAWTPDGTDVVVTHGGSGGTGGFIHPMVPRIAAQSDLKVASIIWMQGSTAVFNGAGWFTRKDATGTSVHDLVVRPAAALRWIDDNLAANQKLGVVGSSMGTMAMLGAGVWYGLDPIIDYYMLVGGPGFWDVNAGCGRTHTAKGHCDVDVAECTGNPMSSYGNDDPACGAATNSCRVPTIMAPLQSSPTGSAYDDCINYVGATTACAPTPTESRDASLDESSLAFTVSSWALHGRVDVVTDEGGTQPPNADQGMGLGHMMYIYAAITSEKHWIDNEGTHHGDAFTFDPRLIDESARVVIAGMGHAVTQ